MLALLLISIVACHDDSASFSQLEVRGADVRRVIVMQSASVLEVLPQVDRDADGRLTEGELDRETSMLLASYVDQHFRLSSFAGELQDPLLRSTDHLRPHMAGAPGEWVVLETHYSTASGQPLAGLQLVMDLFAETSPGHLDSGLLSWSGAPVGAYLLGPVQRTHRYRAPRPAQAAAGGALQMWRQLWRRWDLLLLLVAASALAASQQPAASSGVGLACALGVCVADLSLRLGLPSAPSDVVLLATPLAATYLVLDAWWSRDRRRLRWREPLLLGMLAGLGLGPRLAPGQPAGPAELYGQLGAAATVLLFVVGVALTTRSVLGRMPRRISSLILASVGAAGAVGFSWRGFFSEPW